MKPDIRMVFLDIDGTLVVQRQLIPSALEAVIKLKAKNIPVALCTGRSRLHTRHVLAALGLNKCVFFNGGLVESDGQRLDGQPLERAVADRMIDFFEEKEIPLILHTDSEAISFQSVPASLQTLLDDYDYPEIRIVSRFDWEDGRYEAFQANMFCERDWDPVVQNNFPECLLYRWEHNGADLQKRGCDKSEGATILLNHLDIAPEYALHIGDGGNDVGMFKTMGYSVAMGNAHDDVKRHAKMITSPATEDGVYLCLSELGLL